MDDKLFNELEANLKEAVKVAKRHMAPKTTYVVVTPAEIKAIRRKVLFGRVGIFPAPGKHMGPDSPPE